MTELLIGTTSAYKTTLYREMLSEDLTIVTPAEANIALNVEEDLHDIVGNSRRKARAFAKASGMLALSDDSGIFIPALNNEPGVAARRWGGELSDVVSDEEWAAFFLGKIKHLSGGDLAVIKRQVITLAIPDGHIRVHDVETSGTLLHKPSPAGYISGGPFGAYFHLDEFGKAESELTTEEQVLHYARIKENILQSANQLTNYTS